MAIYIFSTMPKLTLHPLLQILGDRGSKETDDSLHTAAGGGARTAKESGGRRVPDGERKTLPHP